MPKKLESKFLIKLYALQRHVMWHQLSDRLDLVLVPEFPKSGGSWFSQMLGDSLGIPFPRLERPPLQKCVMQGHHVYSPNFSTKNMVCVLRDGRDILVSFYHHMYFGSKLQPSFAAPTWRRKAPFDNFEDVRENMPAYIEYMFTDYANEGRHFHWKTFVDSYWGRDILFVRYEDLLTQPVDELARVTEHLKGAPVDRQRIAEIVRKYSFENQAKRKRGSENKKSFLRKGISGDWKNYFSQEACEVFDRYAGDTLIKTGYEKDRSWVQQHVQEH